MSTVHAVAQAELEQATTGKHRTITTIDEWTTIRLVGAEAVSTLVSCTGGGSDPWRRARALSLKLGTAIRLQDRAAAERVLRSLLTLADNHVPYWLSSTLNHVPVTAAEQRRHRRSERAFDAMAKHILQHLP